MTLEVMGSVNGNVIFDCRHLPVSAAVRGENSG